MTKTEEDFFLSPERQPVAAGEVFFLCQRGLGLHVRCLILLRGRRIYEHSKEIPKVRMLRVEQRSSRRRTRGNPKSVDQDCTAETECTSAYEGPNSR
jgi:hypothetical protein